MGDGNVLFVPALFCVVDTLGYVAIEIPSPAHIYIRGTCLIKDMPSVLRATWAGDAADGLCLALTRLCVCVWLLENQFHDDTCFFGVMPAVGFCCFNIRHTTFYRFGFKMI